QYFLIAAMVCLLAFMSGTVMADLFDPAQTPFPKTPQELDLLDIGTIAEVVSVNVVKLDNGKHYALDLLRIPIPLQAKVHAYLQKRLLGQKASIYAYKNAKVGATDRNGYPLAH